MNAAETQAPVDAVRGYHTIDLGHGIVTPGIDPTLARLGVLGMPGDLTGRTVLDIGAWDGAFSFEAERRGASRDWCGPNPACVIGMLQTAGFSRAQCVYTWLAPVERGQPQAQGNAIFHAWK